MALAVAVHIGHIHRVPQVCADYVQLSEERMGPAQPKYELIARETAVLKGVAQFHLRVMPVLTEGGRNKERI